MFEREQRYVVLKLSDIDSVQRTQLKTIQAYHDKARERRGANALECVVVEKDWPEYERTWNLIEQRVTIPDRFPHTVKFLEFESLARIEFEKNLIWKDAVDIWVEIPSYWVIPHNRSVFENYFQPQSEKEKFIINIVDAHDNLSIYHDCLINWIDSSDRTHNITQIHLTSHLGKI
jgi:hypothetical protein